ncbi:MAG: replicative helicase Mcm [Thermoproteota archaeon]|nr:replicative helicase Mcm [Thermoproteota archaeon]
MTDAKAQDPVERFQNLLKDDKYRQRLSQMAVHGNKTLLVDFEDIMACDINFTENLIAKPDEYIGYSEDAAWAQLRIEEPEYAEEIKKVKVRFRGLPDKTPLRFMGSDQIGNMIMVDGILVRAATILPLLMKGIFKCKRCGSLIELPQTDSILTYPSVCSDPACRRTGPFDLVEDESEFINSQEIRIQERPEDLPPGQLPRGVDVRLLEDLVDVARPGDRVTITGIVRTQREYVPRRGALRTFSLILDASYVDIAGKEQEIVQITPDEEKWIQELSRDPLVHQKIIRSIAPSIYGYSDIKEAIMYLLFGGISKSLSDGISIRGDPNILIVGDPGTAKSQLLQYVSKIAPRGLYTSGRGSTAAGLTAAVMREKTGEMTLEAGALVLADRGVCAIDEIDKMRPEDRVAIHEAMEQQTVSVAKGGIIATLNARTSILAAANPALGRYDPYRTIAENINLPVTILSRFDLIFVIRDEPKKDVDENMAEHILALHKTGESPVESPIAPALLRKYISYSKQFKPVLTDDAVKRLRDFYLQMRTTESRDSPIAITARQLESLIRVAEACARIAMRKEITVEDAQAAILLTRKSLEQVGIDTSSGKFDIDLIMTGKPKSLRDRLQVILSTLTEIEKTEGFADENEFYNRLLKEYDIERVEATRLIEQLVRDGMVYRPKIGYLKKT